MKNKSILIGVALVVVLLLVAVGYASFSGLLNITGTATANGNFEVVFVNGVVTTNHGEATVNQADNTKMTANVKLNYPGDSAFVMATVRNNGDVPAKLTSLKIYNKGTTNKFSNDDIEILPPDDVDTEALQPGESRTLKIMVKWIEGSTTKSATADFDIQLEYGQATDNLNG